MTNEELAQFVPTLRSDVKEGPASVNNRLILETYEADRALKSKVEGGLAFVQQKISLVGLKLLVDAKLNNGTLLKAGSKIYFREAILHTAQWTKDKFDNPFVAGQKCLIANFDQVEMVDPA